MKIFSPLYDRMLRYARHRHAVWFLGTLSFMESSFFPLPPDIMLAPMSLAAPRRALFFAFVTTLASVLGGVLGYFIGVFGFDLVKPLLLEYGYWPAYLRAQQWFAEWGFWAVLLAGFSPIPYKVFTIAAGVASMALAPFILASTLGRGGRFFLVALLMAWGGARMEGMLRRHIDRLGWLTVAVAILIWWLWSNGK